MVGASGSLGRLIFQSPHGRRKGQSSPVTLFFGVGVVGCGLWVGGWVLGFGVSGFGFGFWGWGLGFLGLGLGLEVGVWRLVKGFSQAS